MKAWLGRRSSSASKRVVNFVPKNETKAERLDSSLIMDELSDPVYAEFPAKNLVTGCGVAIFHVRTERVVLCYHTRDKYWFLPKGRRDAGEETRRAAEREGFEEVNLSLLR
jgi:8-oxo-dGTP pyrophosphatase MutT (NUDIX family)